MSLRCEVYFRTHERISKKGNGLWHQRRAGIATFVGVRSKIPAVGVGKTFYSIDGTLTKNQVHQHLDQALLDWHGGKQNKCHACRNDQIIVDDRKVAGVTSSRKEKTESTDQLKVLETLHRSCRGFAVPMCGETGHALAYALVGHGGRGGRASASSRGSKNPIYISVGNGITLQDAVYLCARVSIAKIPEPIREADLYGRRLVREREQGLMLST